MHTCAIHEMHALTNQIKCTINHYHQFWWRGNFNQSLANLYLLYLLNIFSTVNRNISVILLLFRLSQCKLCCKRERAWKKDTATVNNKWKQNKIYKSPFKKGENIFITKFFRALVFPLPLCLRSSHRLGWMQPNRKKYCPFSPVKPLDHSIRQKKKCRRFH